ncbi:MAG: hypothetical protein OXB93_02220, partial [Cytophagales bacterium]|nr:hypothetical protein [Cytophagales bacterium]
KIESNGNLRIEAESDSWFVRVRDQQTNRSYFYEGFDMEGAWELKTIRFPYGKYWVIIGDLEKKKKKIYSYIKEKPKGL